MTIAAVSRNGSFGRFGRYSFNLFLGEWKAIGFFFASIVIG